MSRYRLPKNLGGNVYEGTPAQHVGMTDGVPVIELMIDGKRALLPANMLTELPAEPPKYGERARAKCTATGRYIQDGLVLIVSAQDNDLFLDDFDPDGDPPHPTLPVPSDDAVAGAAAAIRSRSWRRAVQP